MLSECSHQGIGIHNCVEGSEEAGVICTSKFNYTYYPGTCNICLYIEDATCEDGTVHLVGGNDVSRGRVEYCYEGTWYSVCASDWEDNGEEARVVCSTLGYNFGK